MLTTQWLIVWLEHSPSGDVVIITCQITEPFSFLEGQFMMLQTLIDDKIVKRAYSIYSTNQDLQDSQTISFCIKRKEWGLFSTRATQVAKVGMKISMTWPVGKFIDTGVSKNYLFISVGSGLSPCFSLYNHLLQTGNYNKIANLFWERYIEHIPTEVLQKYILQSDTINNQICLSKEENIPEWMRQWYVQDGLQDALDFLDTKSCIVFICGLPAMCDEVAQLLLARWFEKSQLVIEKY
jgi:ferredoxin-NADP reductase